MFCQEVERGDLINRSTEAGLKPFIQLHFKLFNAVNVFIVELFLLYQAPTYQLPFNLILGD